MVAETSVAARQATETGESLEPIEQLRGALAEFGELKAICYASVDADGQNVTLGILQDDRTGIHELIGLSQMLSDAILQSARD